MFSIRHPKRLSAWLGSLLSVLDPDVVVVGGSVSHIEIRLFSRLRRLTSERTINQHAAETPILPAALSREWTVGAAAVILRD